VTVLFAEGLPEIFEALPDSVKAQAAHSINLLSYIHTCIRFGAEV
jgi:hypothetical protein